MVKAGQYKGRGILLHAVGIYSKRDLFYGLIYSLLPKELVYVNLTQLMKCCHSQEYRFTKTNNAHTISN